MIKGLIQILVIAFSLSSCNGNRDNSSKKVKPKDIPIIDYLYITSYPHDTTSFTEGFLFDKGTLYESTGASSELPQTKSLFGSVDLLTGKIDTKVEIDSQKYFGEGITFLNGKVFQLTYKAKVGFIYDATTFKKMGEFSFPSKEGWGLTTDGTNLIMSDGTNILTYLDPNDLHVVKTIYVTENRYAKENLNELEYIKGYIYANVWTTNTIVKIDPNDGKVVGKLDLSSLKYEATSLYYGSLTMNGIAYDSVADRVYVTGKLWPKIYEIQLDERSGN